MKSKFVRSLGSLFGLLLFAVALWVLYHELRAYHLQDILRRVEEIPGHRILTALLLTALSYLIMTGYDVLALRYIRSPLAYGKIALASFVSYAFSNNIGLSMLAGGSVRYRLYSAWGLSGLEITKVVAFCSLTLWLGFLALGGATFLLEPLLIPGTLRLPFTSLRPLGGLLLAPVLGYFLLSLLRKKPLRIRTWEFAIPSTRLFLPQMLIALLDWAMAGSVLYALLPASPGLTWAGFMGIYLLAQLAGLISQVPGGLGIFETVIVVIISPTCPLPRFLDPSWHTVGCTISFPCWSQRSFWGLRRLSGRSHSFGRSPEHSAPGVPSLCRTSWLSAVLSAVPFSSSPGPCLQ